MQKRNFFIYLLDKQNRKCYNTLSINEDVYFWGFCAQKSASSFFIVIY